ncbi:hypothetical protein K3495_g8207 [Podosphaera aphanis]|nr:hypothetical protein K3495_g8207 [Podosphaera aphanis]
MANFEASRNPGNEDVRFTAGQSPNDVIEKYFLENSAEYQKLHELRQQGWENKDVGTFFKQRRLAACKVNDHVKVKGKSIYTYFEKMQAVGLELHKITSALTPDSFSNESFKVLDVCMAPGGISSAVLTVHRNARISAITLCPTKNGYDVLLRNWETNPRVEIYFGDVTMMLSEMGGVEIPSGHPDAAEFLTDRPFFYKKFNLVICDGLLLQKDGWSEDQKMREAWRLITSQLVLALNRVKTNGTLVMVLQKLDIWETIFLLYTLNKFSSVELFKSEFMCNMKSFFYVVAKKIQTRGPEINAAIEIWKKEWQVATFGTESEYNEFRRRHDHLTSDVLRDFGNKVISLAEPIWRIQSSALEKSFTRVRTMNFQNFVTEDNH